MPDIFLHPRDAGRGANDIQLRSRYGTQDIFLRARPAGTGAWGTHDVRLYPASRLDLPAQAGGGGFPTQFDGLYGRKTGSTIGLCLVAVGDAPSGMGGVPRIRKGATTYAVYLVETTDPQASPFRLSTSAGTKAIRLRT